MATTPSPLPPPPQAPPPANIPLALEAIASGVPGIDPEVATGIAQAAPSPPQAQQQAQAAQGLVNAVNLKNWLVGQHSVNQVNFWKQLDGTQQTMLKSAGYTPPHPGRSIWGSVTHFVGQAFHDTLNAANAPLRAEQHVERTLFAVANQSPAADLQSGSWHDLIHALHTPSDWSRAWNETSNGNQYILPQVQAQVAKKYDPNTFTAALALAKGKSAQDIITAAPPAQQQALAQALLSPTVKAATQELLAGHVTTGRELARYLGMPPGPGNSLSTPGAALSGLLDAALTWFGDPVNVVAKAGTVYSTARRFVQTGSDVQRAYNSDAGVQRAFQDIADHLQSVNNATAISKLHAAGESYAGIVSSLPPPDTGALGDLIDRYPSLERSLDYIDPATNRPAGLLHENITSVQDLVDWAANETNLQTLLAGRPARLPGQIEGAVLPSLSRAGQARLAAKQILQQKIDFLADRPTIIAGLEPGDVIHSPLNPQGAIDRIQTGGGQMMRKLLTLTPNETFNIYDRNWFSALRNVALMSLPRARTNALLTDYAAAATHGERVNILRGLVREVMNSAGVDNLPEVSHWIDEATDPANAESVLSKQAYSAGGMDLLPEPTGGQSPAALGYDQTRDEFAMPTYKTLYAQVKKLGIAKATNGALNNRMVDAYMNTIWKPLSLARFGFSLRVAGEEAFGLLLRNGPTAALRARAAASAATRLEEGSGDHPLASVWDSLTSHLPTSVRNQIRTPVDLAGAYIGDATNRAMANVESKLAGPRYMRAAQLWAKHKGGDDIFARYVSAGERHGNAFDDTISTGKPTIPIWNNGRMVRARLMNTGRYTGYTPTATVYTRHYYKRLREIATDRWMRPALTNSDLPLNERVTQVADRLRNDTRWLANRRSYIQRDGSTIDNGATLDSLSRDHAAAIVDHVDYHLRAPEGTEINLGDHTLRSHLIDNRRPPTQAVLDQLPDDQRPVSVSGPESVPVLEGGSGLWQRGINTMFHVIGKQIDWISRTPMFMDNFARGLDTFRQSGHLATWREAFGADNAEKIWVDAAADRALKDTIPYIHHPELRSQMATITRNVAPFWFAQEQFFKRWARTFVYDPSTFRRAQLISQGVAHSGFTHTDPSTGQQYFIYPGAGAVQDVLTKSINFFGGNAYLPIEANLRGQVKMVSPGLERLGVPSLGPAVVIPMNFVTNHFKELQPAARSIEGPISSNQGYLASLVPTTAARLWTVFNGNPNNNAQYASGMMQAIQYLEASGHGIGEVATTDLGNVTTRDTAPSLKGVPGDYVTDAANKVWVMQGDGTWRTNDNAALTAYMERVKNWTRIFLLTRTMFGFNAPASPENLFDPNHVNEDLQTLMKSLPYEEAIAAFMKTHPDATAYTVFQSVNKAGAPLPATQAAMDFMNANAAFFKEYPLAGAFFIPTADATGKYSTAAYQEQLKQQLRVKRTPAQFWQEIAYAGASKDYFAAEDAKNAYTNQHYGQYNTVAAAWTSQSQQFMKANPLFAQQLADTGGAYTRADIEQQLGAALNDPRLPENIQTEDIRTLYNAYLNYQSIVAPYSQPGYGTISGAQKYNIETAFINQAEQFVAAHPDTLNVYNRLIRPEFSAILATQGGGIVQ